MKKILIFILPLLISLSAQAHPGWLYMASFQKHVVEVLDLETKKIVKTYDFRGTYPGLEVSEDGKTLYLVDGITSPRLRLFETTTGHKTKEIKLENFGSYLGPLPLIHLVKNRWLLINGSSHSFPQDPQIYDTVTSQVSIMTQQGCLSPFQWLSLKDGTLIQECAGGEIKKDQAHGENPVLYTQGPLLKYFQLGNEDKFKLEKPIQEIKNFSSAIWDFEESVQKKVYIAGGYNPVDPWILTIWDLQSQKLEKKDLKKILSYNSQETFSGSLSHIESNPDGSQLAVSRGNQVWILDSKNLNILKNISTENKVEIEDIIYDQTGTRLYVILDNYKLNQENNQTQKPNFLEFEVSSGKMISQTYLPHLERPVLKIAPKP